MPTSGSQPPQTISDPSGATYTDDLPTEVPLTQVSSVSITKEAITTAITAPALPGQIIDYTRKTGINHHVLSCQWPGMPQNMVLDTLELLAKEVFPRVRQGV